jgi:hypothetical protein
MAMLPKSNKPRGAVKIDSGTGSPVTSRTANPKRAAVNQAQGPRTGNTGTPTKQKSFLAEKSDRSSYFQQIADMVMDKLTVRGAAARPHINPGLEPVSANTRVRRGPRRGNQ